MAAKPKPTNPRARKAKPNMPDANAPITAEVPAAVEAAAPRTLEQKLAAAEALVAKYKQQIATAAILNNVEVGDDVSFKFGRGDKVRTLTGKVLAIADDETLGRMVGVLSGEGIDIATYKVRVADITANASADARNAEAATEEAPAEADADPLNAE